MIYFSCWQTVNRNYNGGERMTDTQLLTSCIKSKNMDVVSVAKQLGLTRQGFWKKLTGRSEFKQSEIEKLTRLLELDADTQYKIFFALCVG